LEQGYRTLLGDPLRDDRLSHAAESHRHYPCSIRECLRQTYCHYLIEH